MTASSPDPERLAAEVRRLAADDRCPPSWASRLQALADELDPPAAPTHRIRADRVRGKLRLGAPLTCGRTPAWPGGLVIPPGSSVIAHQHVFRAGKIELVTLLVDGIARDFLPDFELTVEGPEQSKPDTVTVELLRPLAERAAEWYDGPTVMGCVGAACRAALAATDPTKGE